MGLSRGGKCYGPIVRRPCLAEALLKLGHARDVPRSAPTDRVQIEHATDNFVSKISVSMKINRYVLWKTATAEMFVILVGGLLVQSSISRPIFLTCFNYMPVAALAFIVPLNHEIG